MNDQRKESFESWINLEGVEDNRTYYFDGGFTYTIFKPKALYVKRSGSHKLIDEKGKLHYVKKEWKAFSSIGSFEFDVE